KDTSEKAESDTGKDNKNESESLNERQDNKAQNADDGKGGNHAGTAVPDEAGSGYKTVAYAIIAGLFVIACALLIIFKKRNYKNFIFAAIIALIAVLIVRNTDIRTKESYYSGAGSGDVGTVGAVTLMIRCDTIVGESSEFIPEDGAILEKKEYGIREGESVYDLLVEAVRENGIHMENKKTSVGAHGAYYISGINHIYEYEYGELSGWMYYVNGEAPSVGCGDYVLKDGDEVAWLYTREIGRDIEQ
ncbi:MAG: DUF4430 domain-containing protein, partial [Lachnospiraceae bacterium]|nr:DUF4430 domain-containing protein [Lachnospiraceae bacterium]